MTIKKFAMYVFVSIFVLAASSFIVSKIEAATSSFPVGCSSALGYSVMTGQTCNGQTSATMSINGCATALGYSITTGAPCSGSTEVLSYLGGCESIYNYSIYTGAPCNGTGTVSLFTYYPDTTTPGLPATGVGSMSFKNILLLISSGLLILGTIIYTLRNEKTV